MDAGVPRLMRPRSSGCSSNPTARKPFSDRNAMTSKSARLKLMSSFAASDLRRARPRSQGYPCGQRADLMGLGPRLFAQRARE